jgi:hypothetical protein
MLSEIPETPKALLYMTFLIWTIIMTITIPEAIITLDPESFIAFYGRLRNS